MKRAILILASITLVLSTFACKKAEDRAAEKMAAKIIESQTGGKAAVDISGGKVKITSTEKGKEGTIEFSGGADLKLPDDFPSDLPVYPGAKIISHFQTGTGNRQIIFKSDDRTKKVYDFYLSKLEKSGWEIVQEMKMAPTYTLVGKKGKRQAAVVIGDDHDKSTISMSVTEEQG